MASDFTYQAFQASNALLDAEKKKKQYEDGYKESQKVSNLYGTYNNLLNSKPGEWNGGAYGSKVSKALDDILNRKQFSYDLNADMLYQQYKDQYVNQGRQAMMDTIGMASAMTGGYGNSYAQQVGQQTYQGYLQGLNDKIPELYQLAMSKYQMEGDQMNNAYGLLKNQYDTEYGQYRDRVSDWNNDVDRAYNVYNNERNNEQNVYNANRDYALSNYNSLYNQEYGQYSDDYNRAFNNYQQGVAEDQFAQELAFKKLQEENDQSIAQRNYELSQLNYELQKQSEANSVAYNNARLAEEQRQFDAELAYKKQADAQKALSDAIGGIGSALKDTVSKAASKVSSSSSGSNKETSLKKLSTSEMNKLREAWQTGGDKAVDDYLWAFDADAYDLEDAMDQLYEWIQKNYNVERDLPAGVFNLLDRNLVTQQKNSPKETKK